MSGDRRKSITNTHGGTSYFAYLTFRHVDELLGIYLERGPFGQHPEFERAKQLAIGLWYKTCSMPENYINILNLLNA